MAKRPKAQERAERTYREKHVSILVRLPAEKAEELDKARGGESRPAFVRAALDEAIRRAAKHR